MLVAYDGGNSDRYPANSDGKITIVGFKVDIAPSLVLIRNLQLDMHDGCGWLLHCDEDRVDPTLVPVGRPKLAALRHTTMPKT